MWFNINWNILSVELLPGMLRQPRMIRFVRVLLSPIAQLHYDWLQQRNDNIYKLSHTGQIFSLEKVLNDMLDKVLRRIYLADGDAYVRPYIYLQSENNPVYLGSLFIHSADNYQDTGVDFKVYAPQSIIDEHYYELKGLVDFYKLDVKRYSINTSQ